MTACPICGRRMKEYLVFGHLDKCTGPSADTSQTLSRELPPPKNFLNQSPRKQQTKLERLPAVNYSTLKDQALRKKMTELGVSSTGSRALVERRHREWRTIWNANCDAVKPRPRAQLVHDLEVWERTQGGRTPAMSRLGQNAPLVKDKDFDGDAWATKYNSSFKDLVANARRSRLPKQEPKSAESGQERDEVSAGVSSYEQKESDVPVISPEINAQGGPDHPVGDITHDLEPGQNPMGVAGDRQQEAFDPPMDSAHSQDNASRVHDVDNRQSRVLDVPVNNAAS